MFGWAGVAVVLLSSAMAFSPDSGKKEDRARELVQDVCTSCHDLARVKAQALSKEEWAGLIKGMLSEGAPVSDEEMDLIVNYLAQHYGYKSAKGAARTNVSPERTDRAALRFARFEWMKDGK
jgi:hypothetical protein